MKRLFTFLTAILTILTATAQDDYPIILEQETFRKVQADPLTGVNIDPIAKDLSRNACARVKIKFANMSRAEIDALEIKFQSNTDLARQEVAQYFDNVLILEMTAKPMTRFYVKHPTIGESNEVRVNLEGDCEYEMEARLNQRFSIIVDSNIAGAEVYIDGVKKAVTDEKYRATINDVMVGSHTLKLAYNGVVAEQSIEVKKGVISFRQNVDKSVLEAQYVVFEVNPANALVIIDNKQYTPVDGTVSIALNAGTYNYSISAKLYHTYSSVFTVAGSKISNNITLLPAFGYLSVGGGALSGAAVFVDDELIGSAPIKSDRLASGEHSVRIVMNKYKPYSTTVTIRDNLTTNLNPTLVADFATVSLTAPNNAEIWVNGSKKGTGSWSGELSTGTYIFEARQDGHRAQKLSKTISSTPARQSYALEAPTPITGSVDVNTTPAVANIYIDGKLVGTTPMKINDILVGSHTLKLTRKGYGDYAKNITITEDKTTTVTATLTKQSAPTPTPATPSSLGKTYKVGDYYNEHGKEGVVFEVTDGGRHGKIVSMKRSTERLQWSSDSYEQGRLIGANSKTDGAYNMSKVKAVSGWQSKYPAFKWCADLGDGWYLPAEEELLTIYKYKVLINDNLRDKLTEWNWSSTERNLKYRGEFCAWSVGMFYGNTLGSSKSLINYVRAVSAF